MVVHNFYVKRIFSLPAEANAPLVIDSDALLPRSVPLQSFQPVARRNSQIVESPRLVQQQQFPPRYPLNLSWQPPRRFVVEQPFGFPARETAYHVQ
jgi:hypothetical protein